MDIQINRAELMQLMQSVIGVVERRQSLPILSNVLLKAEDAELSVVATDLELQVERSAAVQNLSPGQITAPARKLHDICRALPEGAELQLKASDGRLRVTTTSGRYTLSTLEAGDYPRLDTVAYEHRFSIAADVLKYLIHRTNFAMAQQDVRYYLNGLLLEFSTGRVRAVATDGHRLALAEREVEGIDVEEQLILPRKAVLELQRLLGGDEETVTLAFGNSQIAFEMDGLKLISKLIDGRFPDYERVIPQAGDRQLVADREMVRAALSRVSILANEKFRGVRLAISSGKLTLQAQNPEQEEAEEELAVEYTGEPLEIGFNVGYLLDAIGVLEGEKFEMELRGPDASGLIRSPDDAGSRYVVMPMRL